MDLEKLRSEVLAEISALGDFRRGSISTTACAECWHWLAENPLRSWTPADRTTGGLKLTTKAVERTAEAIGEDIAQGERDAIQRVVRLDLPVVRGEPILILYVQMDATGVPVVKRETVGRKGKLNRPTHGK